MSEDTKINTLEIKPGLNKEIHFIYPAELHLILNFKRHLQQTPMKPFMKKQTDKRSAKDLQHFLKFRDKFGYRRKGPKSLDLE